VAYGYHVNIDEKAVLLDLEVIMKKKLIIVFVIFISIGAGLFYYLTIGNIGVKYDTVQVMTEEIGKSVADTGTISSKNIRRYYGNGAQKVEQISLKRGDQVEKGQLLIKYEDNNQQIDLEIQKVEKQIDALEAAYSEAQSGTDMGSVNGARIEIARIKNQIDAATKTRDRTEALYQEGVVSLVELEQVNENIQQLQSSLDIAQNTYNQVSKGLSKNMREKYEAEIGALLLSVDILDQSRQEAGIYSDIEGVVTQVNTFEGDKPFAGMLMLEVYDPSQKIVLVDFMLEDAIQIHPGLEAKLKDTSLDVEINGLFVEQVYPKAFVTLSELGVEENRQTVEIALSPMEKSLAFGVEVETQVVVEPARQRLVVPMGCIIQKDSKQYVNVLQDKVPIEREVTTGIKSGDNIEIIEGVKADEYVIINYQSE